MVDSFNRQILRVVVAQICQSMGWDALHRSTHDTLTDVTQRYLEELGKVAGSYTQLCNRTKPNLDDLHLAFQDTGIAIQELENFVAQVDPLQFIHPFTPYPKCHPCRLNHPSEGDIVDRAEFYSDHLPLLPKTCLEPAGENKESKTSEDAGITGEEEIEKIKPVPLKETSNVMELSESVSIKRRYNDGVIVQRDVKRSRFDIPDSLLLEKKENLDNTDGESLSPATPVSPYLPQEIPKVPEVSKQATKEKLLSPKSTPPETKRRTEVSLTTKKAKINKEKSGSPISAKASPKTPLLSPTKSTIPVSQGSPVTKVKPLLKTKSPKIEKKLVTKPPVQNRDAITDLSPMAKAGLSSKNNTIHSRKVSPEIGEKRKDFSSPKTKESIKSLKTKEYIKSPKTKEYIKSPKTKESVKSPKAKESIKSPKTKESTKSPQMKELTKSKKFVAKGSSKLPLDDADGRSDTPHVNTPKLMIKLLPKAEDTLDSKGPAEKKTSVSSLSKSPNTPDTKATKALKSEHHIKSENMMVSSHAIDPSTAKKEHSKKKKKKKDKDKDRQKLGHKEKRKSEKDEPPIPKIRFKFDQTVESKISESAASSKSHKASSSELKSKQLSTVVIETKEVRSSVITETLSNTLNYDPDRIYFCPVCKKPDDGSPMVGCDGCDEWCHWACVGLIAEPPEHENWYCPLCLSKKEKSKKGKSKKKK